MRKGDFHRPEKHPFGLINPYPATIAKQQKPVTLVKVIRRLHNRPLLVDIFKLAYTLAFSLIYFHKVGWLHKRISPHNVFFGVPLGSASERPEDI